MPVPCLVTPLWVGVDVCFMSCGISLSLYAGPIHNVWDHWKVVCLLHVLWHHSRSAYMSISCWCWTTHRSWLASVSKWYVTGYATWYIKAIWNAMPQTMSHAISQPMPHESYATYHVTTDVTSHIPHGISRGIWNRFHLLCHKLCHVVCHMPCQSLAVPNAMSKPFYRLSPAMSKLSYLVFRHEPCHIHW